MPSISHSWPLPVCGMLPMAICFVMFIFTVAAAEAAVGLAIVIALFRQRGQRLTSGRCESPR